jgi:hypothetical protein
VPSLDSISVSEVHAIACMLCAVQASLITHTCRVGPALGIWYCALNCCVGKHPTRHAARLQCGQSVQCIVVHLSTVIEDHLRDAMCLV